MKILLVISIFYITMLTYLSSAIGMVTCREPYIVQYATAQSGAIFFTACFVSGILTNLIINKLK